MAHALEGRVRQVAITTLPGCAATGGWRRLEMDRKRCEYFAGGTSLVWEVDPERRRVRVYTALEQYSELFEEGRLDGGAALPRGLSCRFGPGSTKPAGNRRESDFLPKRER